MTATLRKLNADAVGLGLRPEQYAHLFEHWPALDYFEIIAENFLSDAELPRANLERVQARYPIVLHGVSLNLLGAEPLDEAHLDRLAELAERVQAPFVSDHLCWTGIDGASHHDLLPTPHTTDLVGWAAERAKYVQSRLGRPFGIENLSSYVSFERSTLSEWDFYTRVVRESGCHFMLDVNNVYVSSVNHGFDPHAYLDAIDYDRVLQVHLAGHCPEPDGTIIDTHDREVCDDVWALYARTWKAAGPFPTLLEWDAQIPPMPRLLEELDRARKERA